MIHRILGCMVAAALLFGCKTAKKEEAPAPQQQQQFVYLNFKLPKFKDVFVKLDKLGVSDFNKAVPERYAPVTDVKKAAFTLGALTADAIVAVKARNDKALIEMSTQMIHYSEMITQDANIKKMAEDLRQMVQDKKWPDLEVKLDQYRDDVINSLYSNKDFGVFIMLQLGGWTEGINRSATLISQNYKLDRSCPISEKGAVSQVLTNLTNFPDPNYRNDPAYKTALENLTKVKEVLNASQNDQYTEAQITEIRTLTDGIKKAFQ
jgi:hypothetical protein